MDHALAAVEEIIRSDPSSPPRICWETNGNMARSSLRQAAIFSRQTGGVVKFDLKAHSDRLHRALTGTSSKPTRANFQRLVEWSSDWPHQTPVVASSLLIPGYVDVPEITKIARFIAGLSADIPYSLLGFTPQYAMSDLPPTSVAHAERCLNAARAEGLTCVHLGNCHLLQPGDY
jgi:pyruvate formate lyase activating enzyme